MPWTWSMRVMLSHGSRMTADSASADDRKGDLPTWEREELVE